MINYNKNFALPNECWKPVIGYEGLYEVSTFENVKSLERRVIQSNGHPLTISEKVLKPLNYNGYLAVRLYKDGKGKWYKVHRLVAEAWIPNPNNLPCINHKDEDKTNNHYSNLEWCSHKFNTNYGTRNERVSKAMTNGKLSKTVYQYTLDEKLVKEWPSVREVERQLGFNNKSISSCCLGKYKTAYGYIWRYK